MRTTVVLGILCLCLSVGFAAQFSVNPSSNPNLPQYPKSKACGTTTMTQSSSQTITTGNSVCCNNGVGHTTNSYWRAFTVAQAFQVCEVEIGVESADSGSGTGQPLTVNLYTNSGGVFPAGTRNLLATASVTVPDQSSSMLSIPITASVPAGAVLVVEIFTPDGETAGNLFFIGSNASAETALSYISAADCSISTPTPTSAIGFPDMHIVMNVYGTPSAPVPALGTYGLLALLAGVAAAGWLVVRRLI